jgi:P27 family predicted phage terminase small subunit
MGRSGRQPIPTDLKALSKPVGRIIKDRSNAARLNSLGTFPETKPLHGEVPTAPKDLKRGTEGREYWDLYWQHAGAWLVRADYPLVVRLCRLHNVAEYVRKRMDAEGMFVVSETTERSSMHSLMGAYDRTLGRIERLEDRLGLNPVERSRIRVTPKEKESAIDRWNSDRTASIHTTG